MAYDSTYSPSSSYIRTDTSSRQLDTNERFESPRRNVPSFSCGDVEPFLSQPSSKFRSTASFADDDDPFYNEVEALVQEPERELSLRQSLRRRQLQGLNVIHSPVSSPRPKAIDDSSTFLSANDEGNDSYAKDLRSTSPDSSTASESLNVIWDILRPVLFLLFVSFWLVREPIVRCVAIIVVIVTTTIADPFFYICESLFSRYYVPTARFRLYFTRAFTTFFCLLLGALAFKLMYGISWQEVENFCLDLRNMAPNQQKVVELDQMLKTVELKTSELDQRLAQLSKQQLQQEHEDEEAFNYASIEYGAQIVHSMTSPTFETRRAIKRWLVPRASHPPEFALDHSLNPGHCWWMVGSSGKLVIKLSESIVATSVTIGHPSPRTVIHNGSVPKDMQLFGYHEDTGKEVLLSNLVYDIKHSNDNGKLQTFYFNNNLAFRTVILRISSNYGHKGITELYSVRVHGHK